MENLTPGLKVLIRTSRKEYEGIVMPRTDLSDDNHVVIKLKSGYNVGFLKEEILDIKKLGKAEKKKRKSKIDFKKSNPNISIVSTGGTITSKVDYETGGVAPFKTPKELIAAVPELADFVNVKHIHTPFRLLSEDMTGNEWGKIAKLVYTDLKEKGIEGVVVTHGTDTLHFTSAALSFMIQDLNKPVAVVGAQKSIDRGSFDGAMNLVCGAQYCLSDIAEVAIVMHGSINDEYCIANRGTKVRKMSTSRRDTFRPVNEFPLAKIWADGNIIIENSNHKTRSSSKPSLDTKFEEKVGLLHHYPGSEPKMLDFLVKEGYKGVIFAGTGFGHLSTKPERDKFNWIPHIKNAVNSDIFIGMTSQAFYGKTDPLVYSAGRLLKDAGVVYLRDMLPETAFVKLGWVLGHTKKQEKAEEMMLKNYAGELNDKIAPETFLY